MKKVPGVFQRQIALGCIFGISAIIMTISVGKNHFDWLVGCSVTLAGLASAAIAVVHVLKNDYTTVTGQCISRQPDRILKRQTAIFQNEQGEEYSFVFSSEEKLVTGQRYRIYLKSQANAQDVLAIEKE